MELVGVSVLVKMRWKVGLIIAIFMILILFIVEAITWQSVSLFSFDDDDGAPATYTAEILDGGGAKPSFSGTLTKVSILVDVTTGTNIDAGEGTSFYHCETATCADRIYIGGLNGTGLNTEAVYWINSTNSTLLARFEHDGADSEFLNGTET